jgi:hypothetical protein
VGEVGKWVNRPGGGSIMASKACMYRQSDIAGPGRAGLGMDGNVVLRAKVSFLARQLAIAGSRHGRERIGVIDL